MTFTIQRATPQLTAAIAAVKRAVWEDEPADETHIATVIAEPDHATHIAVQNDEVVGFVDGFLTLSAEGVRRWEVDLLGVLPAQRGQGIASQLVALNTRAGFEMGASRARGLVAIGNIGSEKTFVRSGFQVEDTTCGLYVSDGAAAETPTTNGLHLLPVNTINYRGVWLEGVLSAQGFRKALAVRARYGWDVAGAVIPLAQSTMLEAAQAAGYASIGEYRWWHHSGR
jgi:ribosomal protein S18 acetylase RimI-like enzyme